jgi:hypothetical protein
LSERNICAEVAGELRQKLEAAEHERDRALEQRDEAEHQRDRALARLETAEKERDDLREGLAKFAECAMQRDPTLAVDVLSALSDPIASGVPTKQLHQGTHRGFNPRRTGP